MSAALRALHEEHSRIALTLSAPGGQTAKKFPQYLAALLATLSAFAAGSALAWTSSALPLLLSPSSPIPITHDQGSWIGSLINLGAFLGALPAGLATDSLGRRRTLLLLSVPLTASWLLITLATTASMICAGRFLGGMAIGAISVASPMYIAELSESSVRGSLGTFFQLQITLGILFSYLVGLLQDYHAIGYISCAVPVLFLVLFYWMPESPTYLLQANRKEDATRAMQWFRGRGYDVEDELTRMQDADSKEYSKATLRDLVGSRGTVKALVVMLGLMWFQQMCGINAVVFYTGQIFELCGSSMPPSYAAIIVGAVMVLSTYVSTLLVDRAGRRVLLLTSSVVMSLCLGVLGVYFYAALDSVAALSWLPLAAVAVYIVLFSVGFGPIPWMMLGEVFPGHVKGLASALIAGANWLLAFVVTKVFQNLVDFIGIGGTFWAFGAMCVLGTVFVSLLVPETKGKDLQEIQDELCGRRTDRELTINTVFADKGKC